MIKLYKDMLSIQLTDFVLFRACDLSFDIAVPGEFLPARLHHLGVGLLDVLGMTGLLDLRLTFFFLQKMISVLIWYVF